jgi:hypothetical protein
MTDDTIRVPADLARLLIQAVERMRGEPIVQPGDLADVAPDTAALEARFQFALGYVQSKLQYIPEEHQRPRQS